MKTYNLCLLGFGNVGRSLARLLQEKTPELRDRYGIEWRITGIATRRLGWLANPNGLDVAALLSDQAPNQQAASYSTNVREWLSAAQADVMFEVSSLDPQTGQPAIDHLRAALEYGADAITANKGPIVHAYSELRELAASKGKHFLFEATVMGGVPIFSLFRETLPAVRLLRVRGIFNSTTNIILSDMAAGLSMDEAIKRAQAIGIAETDPSYDLDGWDATVKVAAIATVLMNVPIKLAEIQREGIRGLTAQQVQAAQASSRPYKLVCRIERTNTGVNASVRPEQVTFDDPLAQVTGTSLLANFEMDTLPGLTIIGHNLSKYTTAYDLLADFINTFRYS